MGHLWRSEEMQLINLFIPAESAHETVHQLGDLGMVQFRDLNPNISMFQRNFVNEVKRTDEMDRKLRYFIGEVKREFHVDDLDDLQVMDLDTIGEVETPKEVPSSIDEMEAHFEDLEKELQQMNSNQEMLRRNFNELVELEHVLMKDTEFFATAGGRDQGVVEIGHDDRSETPLLEDQDVPDSATRGGQYPKAIRLGFLTGVINREKIHFFERILWRATRGNLYMKMAEIDDQIPDPNNPGKFLSKNVFIIFYQGARAQAKIKKICESYGAHLYPCPDTPQERQELLEKVQERLEDLQNVLERSTEHRHRVLANIAQHVKDWQEKATKEKAVYHTLNMFLYQEGRNTYIAEGWCPSGAIGQIEDALVSASKKSGSSVRTILERRPTKEVPPTYFKTDKFTEAFQAIVDSYGVARYQEINPGPFTIITFPFLFGIMFGDVGHGFLLLLFALFLIIKEKELGQTKLNEMISMCFGGRYVLLLMSLFSIYCGAIYNEVFSVPTDFWGSRWEMNDSTSQLDWTDPSIAYPFGVDPAWKFKKNELLYYNSLKMKISVIFGVTQMSVGIVLSFFNALHFRKLYDIFFVFIPQILFMEAIFGYMCVLIFFKWCTNYLAEDVGTGKAPQLLNMLIYMFLKPFDAIEGQLYDGQKYVQWILILVAAFSVPVMLFVKPCCLLFDHKKEVRKQRALNPGMHVNSHRADVESAVVEGDGAGSSSTKDKKSEPAAAAKEHKASSGHGGGHGEDEEFHFDEIFVHQIIHTIEFVLGAVSNTASYLRLWALSLAHAELAMVFWEDILVGMLVKKNFFMIFIAFAVWAAITFGVLLVMESLSAFLHALRLHWVEFQNKFYQGDGYAFEPFSFYRILHSDEDEKK